MRRACILLLLCLGDARAQPADCAAERQELGGLPLQLDLARRPGVPQGFGGQAFVTVPVSPGGYACRPDSLPPDDILRGEPGDVPRGDTPAHDLLRGRAPRVTVLPR